MNTFFSCQEMFEAGTELGKEMAKKSADKCTQEESYDEGKMHGLGLKSHLERAG
jgi:hypothetical protein